MCNLELGKTLGIPDANGGWEGSWGPYVLKQINDHGYMTVNKEPTGICGGLTSYPVNSPDTSNPMSVHDFQANSYKGFTKQNWNKILPTANNFPIDPAEADKVLTGVKRAIGLGHRVTFGTLLDTNGSLKYHNGAVGEYNGVENDTWVLTSQIAQDARNGSINAGHEMIITGYNDTACATYKEGWFGKEQQQCGILTLRNSWGNTGDYYITYDHFKTLVMEAQEIK
ncbi:C1 family peptidase [Piscirickettsia litoralis]|uniref:Peptidase C1A papain C-terminal domain-containing protein n=1 Tax=Piscirickettsia litoralis TaxID=1891921 RepID=A0ABX3A355_9GAMM|nr:hypothetical protein [Piscirickettsia litoralis]ODN43074.1 hypothetical protein BGC07_09305 [Piscirickettsia litoralis]